VTGYRGIRLTDTFQRRFDERPAATGRQQGGGKEWDM
jgi:hypothetical protein